MSSSRPAALNVAPKPVYPRQMNRHGLFGIKFVQHHMMLEERWTPNSLTDQFRAMAELLNKDLVFKKMEAAAGRIRHIRENRNLKRQCRDGRIKLYNLLYGDNTKKIRNFLIDYKEMQRLYQQMPIEMAMENINQRTFVMRKERDRLQYRLDQLKNGYKAKLMERAELEDRIKYENEFRLEAECKARTFRKQIDNAKVRLNAIKTINNTYRKMIQVLRHDGNFYEPILASLSTDIEDQAGFIKHVLFLGMPAIAKFKELSEEYRQLEDKTRKTRQAKMLMMAHYRKSARRESSVSKEHKTAEETLDNAKRYVRETASMIFLKNELEALENTIKQVKFATLCSQAKEIYPRIKLQVENNHKLQKIIENDILGHQGLDKKMKRAQVLEGILINNLNEHEVARKNRIRDFEEMIKKEDEKEKELLSSIKNRSDAYVMLRYSLWNLSEMLRHVDRPPRPSRLNYKTSYLKLPLLKFEMLTMRACPPEPYEDNIDAIMHSVISKVHKLMRAQQDELSPTLMEQYIDRYQNVCLESMGTDDWGEAGDGVGQEPEYEEEDVLEESKALTTVPNRKQIKLQSAKLVEELSKKDD